MLAAFLIAGLAASILSNIVLLLPWPSWRLRAAGAWPWSRRLLFAFIGTAAVDAVSYGVLRGLGVTRHNVYASLAALTLMSLLWLPATRRWNARGHVCWSSTIFLFAAYLAFMLQWTFTAGMPATSEAGGVTLWVLEVFAAVLGCAYLWELCDALASEHWRRRVSRGAPAVVPGGELPFVSLHVPAHNEPPDMVIATLSALRALDYPRYEVVAIDDNTDDESLWRPVETWCHEHGVKFAHLADWPGYKSGALNYALANLTDPAAELIGVVDADYHMDADFLRRCAPLFAEPSVGFIQAPQDYRDWQHASYYRRLYYSYSYFFAVSQPSRNERDGAIFAGTMGLIRRRALEDVGGWDEWCITEDAELSLRLLRAGWSGLHVDKSFGYGVMPLTFEALKGQRFRWCFGGIQILRMHWRSLVAGFGDGGNRLTLGQRWAYLSGALQWYGDFLALLFFFFLLGGAINIASGGGLLFRKLSAFLIATIGLLVGIGIVRAVALLRRRTGAGWHDAIGAFLIWQSTSLITARASVQALFAKEAEFLRTPKTSEEAKLVDAVKGNWGETLLMLAGLGGIAAALTHPRGYAGPLTAGLLLWPTIAYGTASVNSIAAQRAALPADLRARRRTEFLRSSPTRRLSLAAGGLLGAGAVAVAVLALLSPGRQPVAPPSVIGPAQGHRATAPANTAPTSNSPSATPSASVSPSAKPSTAPTSAVPSPSAAPSTSTSATPTATPTATATPTTSSTP
ncbi:MAG TPA: glycosyltransferase family 2 protein [Acidothermaceae bacterium]|nr:glycosyltransferase family 2 protein [Acidothermaceae bacterium]